jgi:hypothetical protein
MPVALGVLSASQFFIKTNGLVDILRVFWDNKAGPTETHDEYGNCKQQR